MPPASGEELADRVPEADVGRRAGARRLADRRLVDFEHAVDGAMKPLRRRSRPARRPRRLRRPLARAFRQSRDGHGGSTLASSTSRASVDLPSRTRRSPVTSAASGTPTSTGCRLCRCAPSQPASPASSFVHRAARPADGHRLAGSAGDRLGCRNLGAVPSATSRAATLAGAGADVDDVVGAADGVSSCSTTTSVLPWSLSASAARRAGMRLSRGCRPMVGRRARSTRPQVAAELRREADALRLAARERGAARSSVR